MKILVTGAKGQLGFDVMKEAIKRGHEAVAVDREEMDITDPDCVARVMRETAPDAVVHCAAWTAVDAAEEEANREAVYAVNVKGTANIADECKRLGCKLLYPSTDYIFDGNGEHPRDVYDEVNPLNYYGLTKYEGERAIRERMEHYFIVRISWVFGVNGKNFVRTMLEIAKKRDTLTVVNDQVGSPTYTPDLAKLLVDMAETEKYGTYHATNEGYCSWFEFAKEIFRLAGEKNELYGRVKVLPVTSAEYPAKAKRPFNSRLNKEKLYEAGFDGLPGWQNALSRYLSEIEV